ncbi:MAG: MBL fold metallo-hydrolase [Acidobacteria bacterium]|nr:MBL fold metallo-hydrolase [Acidobacteriota bacterium]
MVEHIEWLGHSAFRITGEKTIYIDPRNLKDAVPADAILISHPHDDHFSPEAIKTLLTGNAVVISIPDIVKKLPVPAKTVLPNEKVHLDNIIIEAIPAYNINKSFHPKQKDWVGFLIEMNGKRYYYAGDTDAIPEMRMLKNIDVAMLPVGGTYTMNAEEAAAAANTFKPKIAIPYHWGEIVGTREDAEKFKSLFSGTTEILEPK